VDELRERINAARRITTSRRIHEHLSQALELIEGLDNRSYDQGMPTTSGSTSRSTSTTDVQTGGSQTQTINAEDLAVQLDNSQSSVIYVDLPGCDDKQAAAMLTGDPPLHVEQDAVRGKWAVRKATDEEVADAKAAAEAAAASTKTASTSTSSSV